MAQVSGECLVLLAATVAAQIASGCSEAELATLAAFLTTLGDNLALIATQRANCASPAEQAAAPPS